MHARVALVLVSFLTACTGRALVPVDDRAPLSVREEYLGKRKLECEAILRCCPAGRFADAAACEARPLSDLEEESLRHLEGDVEKGWAYFDPAAGLAWLDGYRQELQACDGELDVHRQDYVRNSLVGTRGVGESCDIFPESDHQGHAQCAPRSLCDFQTRTCQAQVLPGAGEPCTVLKRCDFYALLECRADDTCGERLPPGSACTLGQMCVSGRCTAGRCASLTVKKALCR